MQEWSFEARLCGAQSRESDACESDASAVYSSRVVSRDSRDAAPPSQGHYAWSGQLSDSSLGLPYPEPGEPCQNAL